MKISRNWLSEVVFRCSADSYTNTNRMTFLELRKYVDDHFS